MNRGAFGRCGNRQKEVTRMLPETLSHLQEHDFVRGDQQADRDKICQACLDLLVGQPVERHDQIQELALIVPEIRYRVLGSASAEVEHELDGLVAPATGPTGCVQEKLDSGLVLCTATVTRRLSNNYGGGEIMIKRPGRFVTASADLIDEYYLQPAQERLVQTAKRYRGRFELSIERRPELAARYQPQIAKAYDQLALELPRERS